MTDGELGYLAAGFFGAVILEVAVYYLVKPQIPDIVANRARVAITGISDPLLRSTATTAWDSGVNLIVKQAVSEALP